MDFPLDIRFMGTLDGFGMLERRITVPPLGPGAEAVQLYLQGYYLSQEGAHRNPGGGGKAVLVPREFVLGTGSVITGLDPSL